MLVPAVTLNRGHRRFPRIRKPRRVSIRDLALPAVVRTGSEVCVEARARNRWQSINVGPSAAGASFWAEAEVRAVTRDLAHAYASAGSGSSPVSAGPATKQLSSLMSVPADVR